MADIRDVIRFAGTAAPGIFGPLALMNEASYALYPREQKKEDTAEGSTPVGKVVSYLNERPYKIYAGKEYGPQSVASYLKLRQSDPNRFPRPAGLDVAQPAAKPQAKIPPSSTPNWNPPAGGAALPDSTAGWGGPRDVNTGSFPAEARRAGAEPGFEEILDFLKETLSPEGASRRTDEAIRQFAATTAVSAALGEEKSRQRFKRELELERIKQWTDLAKTTMQTNVLSQTLLGQALIQSQQPNAAIADILSKGTQAAQGVLGGFQLRV